MQDFESAQTEIPDTFDVTLPQSAGTEPLETDEKGTPRPTQREGLPTHYRMRAERHYVDSITSASFTTRTRSAWTPMIVALGAMALEHATAAHGGASDLVALDEGGSSIQLTFCRL